MPVFEPPSQSLRDLLLPLLQLVSESDVLRADSLGYWRSGGDPFAEICLSAHTECEARINVGIFAGLHGDEPGGILGLIQLIRALDAHPPVGGSISSGSTRFVILAVTPTERGDLSRSGFESRVLEELSRAGSPVIGKGTSAPPVQRHHFPSL